VHKLNRVLMVMKCSVRVLLMWSNHRARVRWIFSEPVGIGHENKPLSAGMSEPADGLVMAQSPAWVRMSEGITRKTGPDPLMSRNTLTPKPGQARVS
jgi:hypothetical protein